LPRPIVAVIDVIIVPSTPASRAIVVIVIAAAVIVVIIAGHRSTSNIRANERIIAVRKREARTRNDLASRAA
jgi:hypothetical protein